MATVVSDGHLWLGESGVLSFHLLRYREVRREGVAWGIDCAQLQRPSRCDRHHTVDVPEQEVPGELHRE